MEWISQEGGRGSTCGRNDRDHEIISIAGGSNIFADRSETSFTASDEEVISRNPQVIIISADTSRLGTAQARGMLASRSGWRQTEALRDNRVYVIDQQLTWANPRMIEGIEQCARLIHPELFR
jgi:iron complex transport system substrate-binding protein